MSDNHSSPSSKNDESSIDISSSSHFLNVLRTCYKEKPFHFYGRISREDFWLFTLSSYVLLLISAFFYFIPVVGDLMIAISVIYIFICQLSATVRRLHDIDLRGYIVAIPYILLIIYFVMMIPVYAMYHTHANAIMTTAQFITALSYVGILALCLKKGTVGSNKYGTDPTDSSVEQEDYINPDHLDVPEYVGDPWRKFKDKADRKAADRKAASRKASTMNDDDMSDSAMRASEENRSNANHTAKESANDFASSSNAHSNSNDAYQDNANERNNSQHYAEFDEAFNNAVNERLKAGGNYTHTESNNENVDASKMSQGSSTSQQGASPHGEGQDFKDVFNSDLKKMMQEDPQDLMNKFNKK